MSLLLHCYNSLFILIYSILSSTSYSINWSLLFLICVCVCDCRRGFCLFLWLLLVTLYLSEIWINIFISLFYTCSWYFCAHLLALLICSKLLSSAILLVFGYCLWFICLSVVVTSAFVVFVVATGTSVVVFSWHWYFFQSFSRKYVSLHLFFLLVHSEICWYKAFTLIKRMHGE